MGRQGIRSLKTRVGRVCSISRRRARLYSGDIRIGGVLEKSHNVTSGETAGGKLRERELLRVLNLDIKSFEHL